VRHIFPLQNGKVRFFYTVKNVTSVPPGQASAILFAGVNREDINLEPLFQMAAEYFIHLAVACASGGSTSDGHPMPDFIIVLNPRRPKSAAGTPFSVTDIISMETDQLIELAIQEGFGKRKQEALKRLVCFKVVSSPTALTVSRYRLSSVMVHNV